MKKYLLTFLISAMGFICYGQTEYAQAHYVRIRITEDKQGMVNYNFGSARQDSVEVYRSYKLKNMIDAIQLMERKGWVLLNITDYASESTIITTANFRRKPD